MSKADTDLRIQRNERARIQWLRKHPARTARIESRVAEFAAQLIADQWPPEVALYRARKAYRLEAVR